MGTFAEYTEERKRKKKENQSFEEYTNQRLNIDRGNNQSAAYTKTQEQGHYAPKENKHKSYSGPQPTEDGTYQQFLKYKEEALKPKEPEQTQPTVAEAPKESEPKKTEMYNGDIPGYWEYLGAYESNVYPGHSQTGANRKVQPEPKVDPMEVKRQLKERNVAKKEKEHMEILEFASGLPETEDFEKKSKYQKQGWLIDQNYEYVNNPELTKAALKADGIGVSSQERKGYDYVSDEERAIYNYIYNTEGATKAEQYLEALNLTERMAADIVDQNTEYAKEHPILASAKSVFLNTAYAGAGYIESSFANAKNEEIDINSYGNAQKRASNAIRETVSEGINNPTGTFFYQTGMSMADSAAAQLLTSGLSIFGINPTVASSFMLAGNAATDGVVSAKERGATDEQALQTGFVQGGAEWFFEKYSLGELERFKSMDVDHLMQLTKTEVVKELVKQGFVEGTEEVATSIANGITDGIINGDLSELNILKENYIAQGLSEEEAEKRVRMDFAKQIGMDFLGGMLSGTTMSGGIMGLNYIAGNRNPGETESQSEGIVETEPEEQIRQSESEEEISPVERTEETVIDDIQETENIPQGEKNTPAEEKTKTESEKIVDTVLEYGTVSDEAADFIAKSPEVRTAFEKKTGIQINGNDSEKKNTVKAAVETYGSIHGSTVEFKGKATKESAGVERQNAGATELNGRNAVINGRSVEVIGIEKENGSELKFKDSSGNSYTTSEVKFADGVAQKLYGAAAEIAMVSDSETANSFVQHYEDSMPVQYYAIGFDRFYSLGKMGVPKATALKSLDFLVSNTSEEAMMNAWNLGNRSRENDRAKVEVKKEKQKRKGTGTYEDQTRNFNANAQLQTLVANRTGIDIKRVAGTDENTNGYFTPSMMQMVISDEASNEYATLLHELGEFGLAYNKSDMKELQNMLLRYQAEQSGIKGVGETAALVKAYQRLYAKNEGSKTYEQAVDEMVNDALAGLFSSDEGVDQFVEWLQKDSGYSKAEQKSLVQQLMDLLDHIVKYLKTLVKEGRQSAAAVRAAELEADRVEELRTKFLEVLEGAIETAHTTGEYEIDSETKFSLYAFEKDGRKIVIVDQGTEEFEGKDRSEYPGIAKKIINRKFNGRVIGEENKSFLNGQGRDEYTHPSKPIKEDYIYDSKMRASAELDNLMDAGIRLPDEEDGRDGHVHDSAQYWIYYKTLFKVGDYYFEGKINIEKIEKGLKFKDITKIEDVTEAIMNSYGVNPKFQFLRTSSNNILSNNKQNATPEKKNSFAGVEAATVDKSMLELANEMDQRGEDSETIRKHTGWHRGYDGKWRFEIDDSQMELLEVKGNYMKLDGLVKHDKLFEAYPILRKMDVYFQQMDGYGKFDTQFFAIDLNVNLKNNPEQLRKTVMHEIQHVIQSEEGFANGANTQYWQDRIDNGYDSRPNSVRNKEWELRKKYLEWQEEDPEFVADMERLDKMIPDMPRGEFDFDTWEQISEDPAEWQQYDAERERLEEKYGEEQVWDYFDWKYQTEQIYKEGRRTATELYYDTAGEIEARETADRLSYDETDRKRYQPKSKQENFVRDNVVIANKIGSAREEVYAAHVDQNVLKKAEEFKRDGYKNFERVKITDVTERIKTDVEKLAGVDATGYQIYATTDTFKHIEKRHGENGKHDQTMKDMRDVALMGYVLNNYDSVELVYNENGIPETTSAYSDKNGKPSKLIKFGKEIDGIQYVVVATSENKYKKLWVLSEYRTQKKDTSQSSHDNTAPPPTPEANSDNVSFDDIISKDSENASEEFKHSISTEEYEELRRQHENTLRENDIFRHMIDYLTRSIEATKGTAISEKSAEGVANRMIRRYKSEADKGKFAAEVQKLFKMMSEGKANKEDFLYFAEETIRPVVEQSKNNKQISDYAKRILSDIIKTPIKLGKLAKQEAAYHYGSYNDFRRKLFGRAQISDKGTDLDILWQQWSGIYPELFDAETVAEDQPVRLAEIIDALKEDYDSEVGYNLEEAVTYAAMELMEEYAKLPEVKALTAAQDMAQMQRNIRKLNEEYRQQYEQKLQELKGEHREKLARQEAKFRARMSQSRSNRLEAQEKKKYRDSIVKNTKEITRWFEVNNDKNHVPEVLKETAFNFLKTMDFESENGWKTQDTIQLQNRLNILHRKLSSEMSNAEGSDVVADIDPDFLPTLDGLITLLERSEEVKKIGDMDSAQLKEVAYLVGTLKRVITTANTLAGNKQYQHVSELGDDTIKFLEQLRAKKKQGKWTGMADTLLNIDMLDSGSFFEQMGNGAKSLWGELREGFNTRTWKLSEAQKYMQEVIGDVKIKDWTGKNAKLHSFEYNGQKFDMTTGQLINLYLLSKRPQAYNHLMAGSGMQSETGGFKIDAKSIVKGQTVAERRVKVTDAQMKEMFKTLTPEQIRIADAMQRFLAKDCASWGNEVSMTLYGYKKFGEKTYWPIKTDENFNKTDDRNADTDAMNTSLYAIRNQGMTKNLVKNANNPIVVGDVFDVFTEHVANMANYNAFVVPLSDAMKWYNYRSRSEEGKVTGSIKEEMERSYGKKAKAYFTNFIKDVNGETNKGTSSEIANTFTSKYKAAAVGANLRVVIQQPTAIFRAMAVMNPKYIAQAVVHKLDIKQMHENSAIAVWKSWGYFETGLGQSMKQIITGESTAIEKAVELSMKGAGVADDITWGYIWNAVKAEVADQHRGVDVQSKEYMDHVKKRFDEVIDKTQVVDTVLHKSQIMRSNDGFTKMATAFMSEPTKTYNILHNAIREVKQNNTAKTRSKLARAVTVYALTAIITAGFSATVDAIRDDDEEKAWMEKFIENWKSNSADNINPMNLIPYLKEIPSLWQGYDSSRMDTAGIASMINAVQEVYKYQTGESKKTLYGLSKNVVKGLSQITGMPMYNTWRDMESLVEQFSFAPFDEKVLTGKVVRIRIMKAMNEGNEEQLRKYLGWYTEQYEAKIKEGKTDKEAKSALKSSITSQWKKIYQNATMGDKIKIKNMLLKIQVNGQQLYKAYDWSSWDEK